MELLNEVMVVLDGKITDNKTEMYGSKTKYLLYSLSTSFLLAKLDVKKPLDSYHLMAMEVDSSFPFLIMLQMREPSGWFVYKYVVCWGLFPAKWGVQNEADIWKKGHYWAKEKLYA